MRVSAQSDRDTSESEDEILPQKQALSQTGVDSAPPHKRESKNFDIAASAELSKVDVFVHPCYRKRKLMTATEAREMIGFTVSFYQPTCLCR